MQIKRSLQESIGKNIKKGRRKIKISQKVLSFITGINRASISRIENAKRELNVLQLQKISEGLRVKPKELLRTDIDKLKTLLPIINAFHELANERGINNIFKNNGGRLAQVLHFMNLKILPGREGNDAVDEQGNEYELKSVNIKLTKSFSTHHHMNPIIIKKYRKVNWIFAVYEGIELVEIFKLTPSQLALYYTKWLKKWRDDGNKDINNPKIPLSYVRERGELLFRRNE